MVACQSVRFARIADGPDRRMPAGCWYHGNDVSRYYLDISNWEWRGYPQTDGRTAAPANFINNINQISDFKIYMVQIRNGWP